MDVTKLLAVDLTEYIKEKHNQDRCIGFSDGYEAAMISYANAWDKPIRAMVRGLKTVVEGYEGDHNDDMQERNKVSFQYCDRGLRVYRKMVETEEKTVIQIAYKALNKNMDIDTLRCGDDLYGKEHLTDKVWDYVVQGREEGMRWFRVTYESFLK